jgi:hypothetical protein
MQYITPVITRDIHMAKATIKSRTGAVITVEGSDTEVSTVLTIFERSAAVGQTKTAVAKQHEKKKATKKRLAASDLIVGLRERGFFAKPKSLSEIAEALEEEGFLYPVTTLSGIVLGLVKKKELRRKKIDGRWAYGK